MKTSWLAIGKWGGAGVISIWAALPVTVQALMGLMLIDYASGLLSAAAQKSLSSAVGMRGLAKKAAMLLLLGTGHLLMKSMHLPFDFATTLAVGFAVNEAISIVENAAELGAPIPPALLELLVRSKKLTGRGVGAARVKEDLEG